jgi:RNA polymerase sigma-70 factor, ECF subfamily
LTYVAHALTVPAGGTLHERALAGDEEAFDALLGPMIEPALRLAYSMLGDRNEAEDATQESITRAWRKLRQLRQGMPVRPWFLTIVANECRNVRRTRWFRSVRTAEVFRREPQTDSRVERIDLARALARLPDGDRQALFLRFYLDLPIEEVATVLGISASAAKGRIYRACHRLRPDLLVEDK